MLIAELAAGCLDVRPHLAPHRDRQMMRREVLDQVGLLDEAIFYGPEDADLCHRLREAGWKIKYLPQYSIIHTYYRRTQRKPFSRLGRKHIQGLLHFYHKHGRIS